MTEAEYMDAQEVIYAARHFLRLNEDNSAAQELPQFEELRRVVTSIQSNKLQLHNTGIKMLRKLLVTREINFKQISTIFETRAKLEKVLFYSEFLSSLVSVPNHTRLK